MNIHEWLHTATRQLTDAGIATARLDALVLLADATGHDRALLLAHPNDVLSDKQESLLADQLTQRELHTPLAYIRGRTEFYGREFMVDQRVLEPRPESEAIIEQLRLVTPAAGHTLVADIGTGSGALAVTAKCELPHITVMATDIDPDCLDVAQANASRHHADITFLQGDLLEPILVARQNPADAPLFALLCNLPYVPEGFHINQAAGHEPQHAIFGGSDGLDLFRRLFAQISKLLVASRPQVIITESLPAQHRQLAAVASSSGYTQHAEDDFVQVFRRTT